MLDLYHNQYLRMMQISTDGAYAILISWKDVKEFMMALDKFSNELQLEDVHKQCREFKWLKLEPRNAWEKDRGWQCSICGFIAEYVCNICDRHYWIPKTGVHRIDGRCEQCKNKA